MKIKLLKKKVENNNSLNSSVSTPFFSSFANAWAWANTSGQQYKVIRDFWGAALPGEKIPEDISYEILRLRLSYEFLAMDHIVAKVPLPEKCRINLLAARDYNIEGLHDSMKGLVKITLNNQEKDEMVKKVKKEKVEQKEKAVKAPKTTRTSVAAFYLEIFEQQNSKMLTDPQIAEVIKQKSGNLPTLKNVASYRFNFNKGKLQGQKGIPKEPVKAFRNSSKPAPAVKKETPKPEAKKKLVIKKAK